MSTLGYQRHQPLHIHTIIKLYVALTFLQEELTYLGNTIKLDEVKLPPAPYCEILKTRGFWALQLALIGALWGNFTLWRLTPLYLNNIQHFSLNEVGSQFCYNIIGLTNLLILQNGALSALPHLCMYFASFPFSFAADWLISSGHFSVMNVRRIMTIFGVGGPALSFMWTAFVGCDRTQVCLSTPCWDTTVSNKVTLTTNSVFKLDISIQMISLPCTSSVDPFYVKPTGTQTLQYRQLWRCV